MLTLLTARHVGLLSRAAGEGLIRASSRRVRRIFTLALGWKHLGVTREDVREQTLRARQARKLMGDVPEGILAGTRRAGVAPILRQPSQAG